MVDILGTAPRAAAHAASDARRAQLRGLPIVLAVDASAPAGAAARVAAALAAERGAVPHVVHAHETDGIAVPQPLPGLIAAADALIGPSVHAPDVRDVRAQLAVQLGRAVDWPVQLGLGNPAGVVVRAAASLGASLVVMGMRRHGTIDRVFHDETTLNVMRTATCPVLGVTASLEALPRVAVVGIDFGPASMRAAHAALALLAEGGTLVLAHVEPLAGDDADDDGAEGEAVYALGADAAFARLETDLLAPADVVVRHVRVPGRAGRGVGDELLALADQSGAQLLAVGSRRHDWLDRALLGSVTSELARDGRHSLLVVPPPPAPPPAPLDA